MEAACAFFNSRRRPVRVQGRPVLALFNPDVEAAAAAVRQLPVYGRPDLAVGDSFALSEGMTCGLPFMELGFPSYTHHCLLDEPYLGFSGARGLAARLLNCVQARQGVWDAPPSPLR